MGIKKLFTFLNNNNMFKIYPYLNDLLADLDIDKKKLLIGVDGNLFCHKYTHSYDNMLIGFFNQVLKFLSNKIIPLYIFDGGTLPEKENTNYIRYQKKVMSKYKLEQIENLLEINNDSDNKSNLIALKKKMEKNSAKINIESITLLLELFDLLNIPYIFSHGEGEYLAVLLNKYKIIDMFLSDDTDPIPAGINHTIKFYNNNVYYLDTKLIYENYSLTSKQFCDLCILLGSDYMSINHGLKPEEILEIIRQYDNIENIIKNNAIENIEFASMELVNKIRNIYYYSDLFERDFIINEQSFAESNTNFDSNPKINLLIDHTNIAFYSNIMLEYWDVFVGVLKNDIGELDEIKQSSDNFKLLINNHIGKSKFNVKNILKYIKNNIEDITDNEIANIIMSFEFLNTFGI